MSYARSWLRDGLGISLATGGYFAPRASAKASSDVTKVADDVLMARYRRGDDTGFQLLFERYRNPLRRFIGPMALTFADTDEIFQETWIAVIQGKDRYVANSQFATFLFSIAHRRCQERWRRAARRAEADFESVCDSAAAPASCEPPHAAAAAQLADAIAVALRKLPVSQRSAFLLRAETEMSLDEISQVMGTNPETTKTRLRYAYQRLRKELGDWL